MMIASTTRRAGLSLTEVIVTLFIMALGIISLMTLFPVGALQMGQALRDDRSGQTASQADGIVRLWWQNEVVECLRPGTIAGLPSFPDPTATQATIVVNPGHGITLNEIVDVVWPNGVRNGMTVLSSLTGSIVVSGGAGTNLPAKGTVVSVRRIEDSFFHAMDNPNYPNAATALQPQRALDNNPSYPVFLDPIGWQARSAPGKNWVTGFVPTTTPFIPRRSIRPLYTAGVLEPQLTIRDCSMMDDITFVKDGALAGQPDTASGSTLGRVVREGAFNWCAVIQRPNNANRFVADLKILVFHTKGQYGGHVPGINPGAFGEQVYVAPVLTSAVANSTQVALNVPIQDLPFRSSGWIMDGSNSTTANFYRVLSVTESGTGVILELDTPLKSTATAIYGLRGLADVFDRPQLGSSGYQRQAP